MSCEHDCTRPTDFPPRIVNRPGLPAIGYRIGAYAELRQRMFDLLNRNAVLAAWTHRGADDPGIALIEGAAVVGDILTFYQQLYANELYLRTAQWRESIAELVRLLGYRLAPGLGGEATFALAVKGSEPVTIPAGFGLKAQLEGKDQPAEFESTAQAVVHPHLSRFHLYRPLLTPYILNGTQSLFVPQDVTPGVSLKSGDRVLLGSPSGAGATGTLTQAQILIVAEAVESFGVLHVKFTTPLKRSGSISQLQAYKLGESYRHFGHNAPPQVVTVSNNVTTSTVTQYRRDLNADTTYSDPDLGATEMPLDAETDKFVAGAYALIEARVDDRSIKMATAEYSVLNGRAETAPAKSTFVREIVAVENRSCAWGMLSGASTVLTVNAVLAGAKGSTGTSPVKAALDEIAGATRSSATADIRNFTIHEVIGAPFTLCAAQVPVAPASGNTLDYFGTDAEAQALVQRTLLLAGPAAASRTVVVTEVQAPPAGDADSKRLRPVTLDAEVTYADFDHDDPQVTVYGNLVYATQGKTQAEAVLGSGDRRQVFQIFALPKSPLTYLLDETRTPAQVPELTVYVDGIAWQQVDAFINYGPDDAVYVVREDADNRSYVQFGDGKSGRRLPSGLNNVTAVYRVGQGAHGELKAGTNPQITGRLAGFDKLYLPAPVGVGAEREPGDNARIAAPGKMQSLGRMVSLADVEAEALALPHVIKVRAAWAAPEGVPLVRLTVLTESGAPADADAVRQSIASYNRCRGPARYPIDVVNAIRQYVHLHIEVGFAADHREVDVIAAIKADLGVAGEEGNGIDGADGLFGLNRRRFGEGAHRSQIVAAAQNATGVTWVRLRAAQAIDLGTPAETDPTLLDLPAADVAHDIIACPTDRLLALHVTHLVLSLAKDEIATECQP